MYKVYALLKKGKIVYIGIGKGHNLLKNKNLNGFDNLIVLYDCKSFQEAESYCDYQLELNSFLEDK